MNAVHALDSVFLFFRHVQGVDHVDTLDHENLVLEFHFAGDFRGEFLVAGIDLARLQRASEGAGESATRCGDYVVECGRMWLGDFSADAVVRCNGTMDTELHRTFFSRQVGAAQRALLPLDFDFGYVDNLGHGALPHFCKTQTRNIVFLQSLYLACFCKQNNLATDSH